MIYLERYVVWNFDSSLASPFFLKVYMVGNIIWQSIYISDLSLPAIDLKVPEGRNNLWGKTKRAFKYAYEKHKDEVDWFLKVRMTTLFKFVKRPIKEKSSGFFLWYKLLEISIKS
jgi:hypothetical protein